MLYIFIVIVNIITTELQVINILKSWMLAIKKEKVKINNALYLSVNVFSTKVLIGDTIFTSPTGDGTAILRGHPSHAKV